MNKICPICGKAFHALVDRRVYCGERCRSQAHRQQKNAASAKRGLEKLCPVCGRMFVGSMEHRLFCSDRCRILSRKAYKANDMAQVRQAPPSSLRHCHDCGRPTTDYRCRECLGKWREKHGVSGYAPHGLDHIYLV